MAVDTSVQLDHVRGTSGAGLHFALQGFVRHIAARQQQVGPAGNRRSLKLTTLCDHAGRVIKTIENYVDGEPSTGSSDEDVTVATTYTAAGQLATLAAVNPTTGDQVTQYVYGTAVGGGTPAVYRNDLLRAVIYPDSDDTSSLGNGPDGIYDRVEYSYNRQAEVVSLKDQNETLHQYAFDGLGRQVADMVTLPQGSDVNDAVLRIERSYDIRGMVASMTSYDAASSGNPVNQIVRQYNDFGQLAREYQEHAGEVDGNNL